MSLDKGYIKLWRSMLTWEWYDDPPTKDVYLHLILTASISPSIWHGIEIPRGSLVSSYRKIAEQTGLTIRQARTAVNHLELTGEVTRSAYPKFTVFTLNNYDKFQEVTSKTQGKRSQSDKHFDNQPTSNRQQYKNIKEDIKKEEEKNRSALAQEENDVRIFPPGGDF